MHVRWSAYGHLIARLALTCREKSVQPCSGASPPGSGLSEISGRPQPAHPSGRWKPSERRRLAPSGCPGDSMPEKKLTVLLVDDSRTVLAQIENVVEANEAVEVIGTARNGAEAVKQVSQLRPDLVIMDIVMPDIDGLAALRLIQTSYPETRVAMLSSVGAMASKAEDAFRLGAIQVLSKPIDEDVLGALLAQECERRRS